MGALGMTALGAFVGAIVTIGIEHIKNWSNVGRLLTTVLSAVLGSTMFAFIEFVGGSNLGVRSFYPIGLLLGHGWAKAGTAVANVKSEERSVQALGWLHVVGLVLITVFFVTVLLSPSFRALFPADLPAPAPTGTVR